MTKQEVLEFLEKEQDPRGIVHWEKLEKTGGLRSYGIGLTRLRKYAKQWGRDAELAQVLWQTDVYEAKILSLLMDEPKKITLEQAERQVEELEGGYLAHVFSSCDATLAKSPVVLDLVESWTVSPDPIRRSCGYGLLYEVSKWKKKSAPDEDAFLAHIARIEKTYGDEPVSVLMAMGGALLGIGKRSPKLHAAALSLAQKIGPIDFDPDGRCDPMDVAKNLQSDHVLKKLGI